MVQDYDQFDHAARLVEAGVAIRVDRLDSRRTAAALRRLLAGDRRAAAMRLAEAIGRTDPHGDIGRIVRTLAAGAARP